MASALGKLSRASWPERVALVRAAALLVAARAALVMLPLRTALRLVDRVSDSPRRFRPSTGPGIPSVDSMHLRRMTWAVEVMGNRLFPKNPCLTQALVIQVLFRRAGRPAELRIGVKRDEDSNRRAHAWVESEGEIVIGREEAMRGYVTFPSLPRDG